MPAAEPPNPGGPTGTYFTGLADVYARCRPDYPVPAVAAMLDGLVPPITAVDVGCGTGISSRRLAAAGVRVIAVDPNPDMLDAARRHPAAPGLVIDYRRGAADALPVPENAAALVLCAQSYHWFGGRDTLVEFHRVLRPGGRLALMWNVRDASDPVGIGYERIMSDAQDQAQARGRLLCRARSARPDAPDLFGPVRRSHHPNPQTFDRAGLLDRARSASYFPPPGDPKRAEYERAIGQLFDSHASDGRVVLLERTEVTVAEVRK